MPPSQLKRLKTSLREQGVTGPQKSKKQKKQGLSTEQRIQRHAALEGIRESFNPFEVKHLSRPGKRDVTTAKTMNGASVKGTIGRPGVTKSLGEQKRRQVLLPELQRRNKVGGILDRRIGENDPTMTPEERALERFTREKQKRKGISLFDLEEDDNDELLTHGGSKLDLTRDDFDETNLSGLEDEDADEGASRKRRHAAMDELALRENGEPEQPERKKTKTEVMQEVIAKSKFHKYERQQAKEEDDVVREELDKDLLDVRAALNAFQNSLSSAKGPTIASPTQGDPFQMNPERMALLNGTPNGDSKKAYDQQLRQIAMDKRAIPTERTKTDEEKALEAAERLKELEENRMKRMAGEESEDEGDKNEQQDLNDEMGEDDEDDEDDEDGDAAEFGLKTKSHTRPEGVDDEDDFVLEDGLIASESEGEERDLESVLSSESEDELLASDDEAAKFLSESQNPRPGTSHKKASLACPQTLEELKTLLEVVSFDEYHETIRNIRILHDSSLHADNKNKLSDFSKSLVAYLAEIPVLKPAPPPIIMDVIIRHIHSMAKKYPESVSSAFRSHLQQMYQSKSMVAGNLVILTAIGAVFPTSDHFHHIVTPAVTLMARWLGMTAPRNPQDLATGAYVGSLCLKYMAFSKRYVPELVRFTTLALEFKKAQEQDLEAHIVNLVSMADLWSDKSAFIEIFSARAIPALQKLSHIPQATKALRRIKLLISQSQLARRPLELHRHKPQPIKMAVPKFEESFDPTKHYDPDRERAESNRLQKEYKRERKGALRELRKDANFLAREKLREKKERDKAYEEKYKKLVSEIQGEEGHEKNAYERVKRARKG